MTAYMESLFMYLGKFKGTFDLEGKLKPLILTDEFNCSFKGFQT